MQNNNWLTWIVILFFGWTAAGIIAGILVIQLGFPYTWISPLTLVMVGAVLFLAYRGYPIHTWLLAGCLGFILISGMAIARALTAPEPNIPDIYRQEFEKEHQNTSVLGLDFPIYDAYDTDYYIEYQTNRDTYLIAPGYDVRTLVTVEFPAVETAGGQWAFRTGSLRLRGGLNATFNADPQQNWLGADEAEFTSGESLRWVHPEMTVAVPLPSNPLNRPLTANAALTLTYPAADGSIQEMDLTRDFELIVVGDDYYYYYDRYQNWERSRTVIETPIWAVLVVGSVLAGAGSVYLIREGALHAQPTSGLRMVIRRLSGSQRLGAELYDRNKFTGLTNADQGVFVGLVVAQSPAGRAGLRTSDVLIEFADKPVNHPNAVNRIAKNRQKGDVVSAVVLRNGERVELRIRF